MPFNFRLNVQSVFRRLGIQTGARLPQLDDNIQMTMLVTDLSRLIPAPIEPRGMVGKNLGAIPGFFSAVQLHSLAAGGLFIESVVLRPFGFSENDTFRFDVTLNDLGLTSGPIINIGGTPVASQFTFGFPPAVTTGTGIPAGSDDTTILLQPGIFVPNQAFFSVHTDKINERLNVALFFRELPSVEEVG